MVLGRYYDPTLYGLQEKKKRWPASVASESIDSASDSIDDEEEDCAPQHCGFEGVHLAMSFPAIGDAVFRTCAHSCLRGLDATCWQVIQHIPACDC